MSLGIASPLKGQVGLLDVGNIMPAVPAAFFSFHQGTDESTAATSIPDRFGNIGPITVPSDVDQWATSGYWKGDGVNNYGELLRSADPAAFDAVMAPGMGSMLIGFEVSGYTIGTGQRFLECGARKTSVTKFSRSWEFRTATTTGYPVFYIFDDNNATDYTESYSKSINCSMQAAVGALTNAAGYAIGATTFTLAGAGSGSLVAGDKFTLPADGTVYTVVGGSPNVLSAGTVTFTPPLTSNITAAQNAITVVYANARIVFFHIDRNANTGNGYVFGSGTSVRGLPNGAATTLASVGNIGLVGAGYEAYSRLTVGAAYVGNTAARSNYLAGSMRRLLVLNLGTTQPDVSGLMDSLALNRLMPTWKLDGL